MSGIRDAAAILAAAILASALTGCTLEFDPALLEAGAGASSTGASSTSGVAGSSGGGRGGGGSGGAGSGGEGGMGGIASAYREAVLADGPIAYWRLGDASGRMAADETGNFPGTYEGGVTDLAGALAGDADGAADFDGIGGYVHIEDEPAGTTLEFLAQAQFSIEAWIRPDDLDGDAYVVCKRFDLMDPMDDGYSLYISGLTGELTLTRVAAGEFDSISAPIAAGVWTYVVATYNNGGGGMRLYLDGDPMPVAQEPSGASLTDIDEPLRIGGHSAGKDWFAGGIDEVALYDKALEYTEIAAHYEAAQ